MDFSAKNGREISSFNFWQDFIAPTVFVFVFFFLLVNRGVFVFVLVFGCVYLYIHNLHLVLSGLLAVLFCILFMAPTSKLGFLDDRGK